MLLHASNTLEENDMNHKAFVVIDIQNDINRPSGKGRDLFYLHPIEREMKAIWQTQ